MATEQVRGQEADKRADIEMLAGCRLFNAVAVSYALAACEV